jgi:hypothetical protein
MKEEKDWMGLWYSIMKERGDNDSPTFKRVHLETFEITDFHFSHAEMDGIGALDLFYNKNQNDPLIYPANRDSKIPSFFECIIIFLRLLFFTKNLKTNWKENNFKLHPLDPHKIEWKIFNELETSKLEIFCKNKKISLNAYLMNKCSHVLLDRLSENGEGTWTLPVNLRPTLLFKNFRANHSSAILVNIKRGDAPISTHENIKNRLIQKQYWGIWWIHQIGKYLGMNYMRKISHKNAKKNFLAGTMSNLGTWNFKDKEIWIGSPPGSKNFPIGLMVMKSSGHLSLSLKIHPYILKNQSEVPFIFNELVESILVETSAHS